MSEALDNETDAIGKQIEADVRRLETHNQFTDNIRMKVIDKLSLSIDKMEIDPNADKASAIEAKMNIVNTLLKALDDTESQRIKMIGLKQKAKNAEDEINNVSVISNTIAEFLRKVDTTISTFGSVSAERAADREVSLNKAVEELGSEILDAELQFTTPDTSAQGIEK